MRALHGVGDSVIALHKQYKAAGFSPDRMPMASLTTSEVEIAAMGGEPHRPRRDDDEDREAVLLDLPSSGLMSRKFGDGDNLVVTIDRGDLAIGDFSKVRARLDS